MPRGFYLTAYKLRSDQTAGEVVHRLINSFMLFFQSSHGN